MVHARPAWLFAGLFCTSFATLLLEILDARLLSVLTWYHLSFLAVSLAMLGMAAGAVHVFLAGPRLEGDAALRRLPGFTLAFALAMAVTHLIVLCIPLAVYSIGSVVGIASLTTTIAALTVPFYFSGIAITIALTRGRAPIGRLYAWDLTGAAFGCLAVVPLLDSGQFNASSLVLLGAGVAAIGAYCFTRVGSAAAGRSGSRLLALLLGTAFVLAAFVNGARMDGLEIAYPKNKQFWMTDYIDRTYWNSHSYVIVARPGNAEPFLWGPGARRVTRPIRQVWMVIDGEAGTPITAWDGTRASLDWVSHDVTTLPYHLRRGAAAVIGFGGGRDILAAIWGGSAPITGIDVNVTMLRLLTVRHRKLAGIADRPDVRLVHDDARSYLTRSADRFDVIQMSLIDTWAATGAGAFTLSENGLYTTDAWRVMLSRLTPTGVFSVSRWFSPRNVSETSRLLALATASLINRGLADPLQHVLLVSRGPVATLMISPSPFTPADQATVRRLAAEEEFVIRVSPWTGGTTALLDRIVRSRSPAELAAATADPHLDFSAPTDSRPFFFNMLKVGSFWRAGSVPVGAALEGNIQATATLAALFLIAAAMVVTIILWPLLATGRPPMDPRTFGASLVYFAAIGLGFMLAQIALLQRFSIYLGHPTHTLSVTLFSMILFAGIGSYLSDRLALSPRGERRLPLAAAGCLVVMTILLQPITSATLSGGLLARSAVVVLMLAPLSMVLGFFFPTGLRLVATVSPRATAWMWGVNGACGVLGSILAVAISLWIGIYANLLLAAVIYGGLLVPLIALQRASRTADLTVLSDERDLAGASV